MNVMQLRKKKHLFKEWPASSKQRPETIRPHSPKNDTLRRRSSNAYKAYDKLYDF